MMGGEGGRGEGEGVKIFQTFGEGAKDKVCSSLFAYSKLNSTFLLGMFFQSSIMKSKIYQSIK